MQREREREKESKSHFLYILLTGSCTVASAVQTCLSVLLPQTAVMGTAHTATQAAVTPPLTLVLSTLLGSPRTTHRPHPLPPLIQITAISL